MNTEKLYDTKTRVPCRISYARINEPYVGKNGILKYSVTCLIDKDDENTVNDIEYRINEALRQGLDKKWDGAVPEFLIRPINDGDELRPNDPAYKNKWFITATSTTRPLLVDKNVQFIEDRSMVYSGCFCNVILDFYPFTSGNTKGITAELGDIQLVHSDESLADRSAVRREFEVIA